MVTPQLNLSKEQRQSLARTTRNASFKFILLVLVFTASIVAAVAFAILLALKGDHEESKAAMSLMLILLATILQFAAFYIMPRVFLLQFIQKPAKKYRLIIREGLNFKPLIWRWFFIASGIYLAVILVSALLLLVGAPPLPPSIGIVVLCCGCLSATRYVMRHLLKSGDAVLQPENVSGAEAV